MMGEAHRTFVVTSSQHPDQILDFVRLEHANSLAMMHEALVAHKSCPWSLPYRPAELTACICCRSHDTLTSPQS